jgi:hypothetical protein
MTGFNNDILIAYGISWTNAIISDGSNATNNSLHARHSYQSLGRWHVQSHAHNSCGLGWWRQWWQPIDLATPLFLLHFLLYYGAINFI